MRGLVILTLAMLPDAALAQCPDRAALEHGKTAYVTYPDGETVGLRWMGEGVIEETTRFEGEGQDFRMLSLGGVFVIDEVDLDGERELEETRIVTRYADNLFDRLPVAASTDLTFLARNSMADGTEPWEEQIVLKSGPLAEVDIAGCRYSGFPMLITYAGDQSLFTSMMTHLPALGVSLEIARMEDGAAPVSFTPRRFDLTPP